MKSKSKAIIVAALLIVTITFGGTSSKSYLNTDTELGYTVTDAKLIEGENDWNRKS